MRELTREGRARAFALYCQHEAFFPLIAAVLTGSQRGKAFGDDPLAPKAAYVEHAFGFAQIFGEVSPAFARALDSYLVECRQFAIAKVRLYTPFLPKALLAKDQWRSERRRFVLDAALFQRSCVGLDCADIQPLPPAQLEPLEATFGLVTRFWPDAQAFLRHSLAQVALVKGEIAAICYAAAVENGRAEIDVLTSPPLRGRGLGKKVVAAFARVCQARGIAPLWDCFTNNAGSLALARSVGFVSGAGPYPFFTIPAEACGAGGGHAQQGN